MTARPDTGAGATLFFEGRHMNPFMSAGGSNFTIDDFNINWNFDRGPQGYVGGYNIGSGFNTELPKGKNISCGWISSLP